jgi:Fur family ferric uptake transcriptional regulator
MLRNTRQRQVILEELKKLKSHPTADELYEIVRKILPRVSLGTIYRNLELLANEGLIQKLDHAGGRSRFDGNPHNHYHVRCLRCGRVDDVMAEPLRSVDRLGHGIEGYKIVGHRLEYIGVCRRCSN